MEPRIRYTKTSDGVNIAWYAIGEGVPFVWPTLGMGDLAQAWRTPELREVLEQIARMSTLVSYNMRGFGLSDRGPMDYSSEAMVRDLEAVVEAAGIERFILQVFTELSVPALHYSYRHPERPIALILLNGLLTGDDMSSSWKGLARLAASDWEQASRIFIQANEPGWALTQTIREAREAFGKPELRDAWLAYISAVAEWDASDVVSKVMTPALVVHYSDSVAVPHEASRRLAAALPNGSFASAKPAANQSNNEVVTRMVRGFLRELLPGPERQAVPSAPGSGMTAILFADIVDSTVLTERLGDAGFRQKARDLDAALRKIISDNGGTPIEGKLLGDGVLATFTSASQGIAAALACGKAGEDGGLPLHLGLHAGDVIREDDNVFGGAVNVAARISGLSAPGEVLVSDTVRSLARTSAGVSFEDRGEQPLKGVGEPVRVWAVVGERQDERDGEEA